MKKTIFLIFGTRPEAIKFAPLVQELRSNTLYRVRVCITSQHKEMLQQVLSFFKIEPDIDLDVMQPNQDLQTLTATILARLSPVLQAERPDLVLVQGDTTTAFAAALAAFYAKIPIGHLEAGLRSGDVYSPFPEEMNRKLTGAMANLHFAPTPRALENLKREGIEQHTYLTGNTVVDALFAGLQLLEQNQTELAAAFPFLNSNRRMILVTGHRRESFGEGFTQICTALRTIALKYPDVEIVYPVHLNPHVQEPVYRLLGDVHRIHLLPPVSYEQMLYLLQHCYLVLTDSGGIQEEAPSLGKPVIVMRDVTERVEGVEAGTAVLAGTSAERIIAHASSLLENESTYQQMARSVNPYGDGTTCRQIATIIEQFFQHEA